jgi:hypothetical protein
MVLSCLRLTYFGSLSASARYRWFSNALWLILTGSLKFFGSSGSVLSTATGLGHRGSLADIGFTVLVRSKRKALSSWFSNSFWLSRFGSLVENGSCFSVISIGIGLDISVHSSWAAHAFRFASLIAARLFRFALVIRLECFG